MAITSFGKSIKIRLIEMEKTQDWLIEQVRNRTGLFFDSSYLWKIMNGVVATPGMVEAIRDILELPDPVNPVNKE